ncbi:MAG TPA: NHL repeat-containing protein [Nitrospirota bacterium]
MPEPLKRLVVLIAFGAVLATVTACASRVVVGRAAQEEYVAVEAGSEAATEAAAPAKPEQAKKPEAKADKPVPAPAPAVAPPAQPAEVSQAGPTEQPGPSVTPRSSRRAEPAEEGPAPYELDMSFGGFGLSQGLFDTPVGVEVDEDENIYVVDQGNYRIQKFDRYGLFQFAWGRQGIGDGEFEVTGISGTRTLRMTGVFEFSKPLGIFLDKDETRNLTRVTVVDSLNNRIQRFLLTRFQGDRFPSDVLVMLQAGGTVPDTDLQARYESEGIQVILDPLYITPPKADSFLLTPFVWGGLGFTQGLLNDPSYLCVDQDGILYVTDTGNSRVQGFNVTPTAPSTDATFFREFGNDLDKQYGAGRLSVPAAIVYDNSGYGSFLVLDELKGGGYVIQRFDKDANFLGVIAESGGKPGQLRHPVGMAVNPFDNTIFVTDSGHRKVMVYNNSGEFLFSFGGNELADPRGVKVLRNNYVYVTDASKNMVYRYVPK